MRTQTYVYSCICISSKPLNPHIHVYTNMRSLLWSEGCFLRISVVVSNSFIHLYTQIRICLYVSWTEWVGPLRYSLIRSYWLSQTGQSAQNRSVPAYYNKQLLPSWTETQLWDPVWLRIWWWVTYHISPSVYWGILCFCMYVWLTRLDGVIVFITIWSFSFHSRYPRSEAWIGGPLRQFIIRRLPVPICILYNDSMAE